MLRPVSTALALVGALGLASLSLACKKTADSANPDAGASGGSSSTAGGLVLRYKPAPVKLKENLNVSFNITGGGQTGAMKADLTGLLDITPSGADKLRVGFSMLDVRTFDLTGNMKPEAKDGKPVPDLKAKLLAATGARIIDLLGDADKAGTKALPENAPKKEGTPEDEFDMSSFGSFLGLPPELPKEGLAEGKPVKVSKEEKENFFSMEIDMETETTYTLVKIDDSSGKRVADIKIESESSGAKELSQGGQTMMLSVDIASEASMAINLDDMLPIRSHIESTTSFSAGAQGGGESRVVMDATYEPAT